MRHLPARAALAVAIALAAASPSAHAKDFARRLPASTLAYVSSDGVDAHREALSTTAAGLLLDSPLGGLDSMSLITKGLEYASRFDESVRTGFLEELEAVGIDGKTSTATVPWAFAVTAIDLSTGEPQFDFVSVFEHSRVARRLLAKTLQSSESVEEITQSGRKFHRIAGDDETLQCIALVGDRFVTTSTVEDMLAWLSEEPKEKGTLADRVDFQRGVRVSAAGGEVLASLFVDIPALVGLIPASEPIDASGATVGDLRAAFDIDRCRAVTATSSVRGGRTREALFIDLASAPAPEESESEPETASSALAVDDAQLRSVPRDTRALWAGRIDPRRFVDGLFARAARLDGEGVPAMRAQIDQMAQGLLGVELAEFLDALGTHCTIHEDPSSRGIVPHVIVRLKPKNAELVESVVEKLFTIGSQLGGGQFEVRFHDLEQDGTTIRYAQFHRIPVPFAPAWTKHRDELVIGLHPAFVAGALEAGRSGAGNSIIDDPEFGAARRALPKNATSIAYFDNDAVARWTHALSVYGQQIVLGLLEATADAESGQEWLAHEMPRLATVLEKTRPQLGVTAPVDGGYLIVTEGSSSGPGGSSAVAAVAAVGVAAVALLPAVKLVQDEANAIAVRREGDKLYQFGHHAMANLDRAPRDVAEILEHRGGIEFEPENEWSVHPTRIGFMLVQESGFQKDGKVLVVLSDGWSGWVRRADFDRLKDNERALDEKMNED